MAPPESGYVLEQTSQPHDVRVVALIADILVMQFERQLLIALIMDHHRLFRPEIVGVICVDDREFAWFEAYQHTR